MSHPLSPLGCIICGSNAVVASIGIERNGYLAHYPTCWGHIEEAVRRLMSDAPDLEPPAEPMVIHHHAEAIDVRESPS